MLTEQSRDGTHACSSPKKTEELNSFNFIIIATQVLLTVVSHLAARDDLSHMLGDSCSQVEPCSLQGGAWSARQDHPSLCWQCSLQAPARLSQFTTFHR